MLKNVVDIVCLELMMQDPEGHQEKEQAEEGTQAMDEFCLHQMPTANLTFIISNPHFLVKGIAPNNLSVCEVSKVVV